MVHIVKKKKEKRKKSCAETIELLMYNNDSCIKEIKLLTTSFSAAFVIRVIAYSLLGAHKILILKLD